MLDINTKEGQRYLEYEQLMLSSLNIDIIQTPKKREADIDGFTIKNGEITSCFESKCRNMTEEKLSEWGGWLVTYEKILKGVEISKRLCVPFYGFLYLIPEKKILIQQITDSKGNIVTKMTLKVTETQESCNGGKIFRTNAYIDMSGCKKFCL